MKRVGLRCWIFLLTTAFLSMVLIHGAEKPNVVLVMADDQGWGQVGYAGHPFLKTPNIDTMAENGLRLDRFYAGAPVCSPTRATVLTGRSNERCGVRSHGYALHLQERTISRALQKAGFATGHFGKWHLNGLRGAGAPILPEDPYHPGHFGFDEWLSVTNFFDMNPVMSRKGEFEEFTGDSSEIVVAEALKFITQQAKAAKPFFVIIWYGSPHSPWEARVKDQKNLEGQAAHHYGELVAMDRSIGNLRSGLRELGVAENTLVWYTSDNGGLANNFGPEAVGGLRGAKGSLWEGGLRVPAVIEWPAGIKPRVTEYPASTMDIMPTLVDLFGLASDSMLDVVDGTSIRPLFASEVGTRKKPIPFQYQKGAALLDNDFKIITHEVGSGKYELYDLENDPKEARDLFAEKPVIAARLRTVLDEFTDSVVRSQQGADYPEGRVTKEGPHFRFWVTTEEYKPYLEELLKRPEFQSEKKRMEQN